MSNSFENIMHEQVVIPGGSPIRVKWNDLPHFEFPWHFHYEMEIVFVLRSYGMRFVADNTESFDEGDLVLVGSQVPHYWKNDPEFYSDDSDLRLNAIIVQFSADFMEKAINNYPEMTHIKELFERSARGIYFSRNFSSFMEDKFKLLYNSRGFKRLLLFLEILDAMAREREYRLLASANYSRKGSVLKDDRLKKILNYINLNYTRQLSLDEISSSFGMNPSAFSRYFKHKTSKTFVQYVNDMRVNYACKLLQEGESTIVNICFECGFNNLSNFNRFFKSKTGITPKQYSDSLS
ncbi:AraC family transcriptional regulator [Marinilabiliaceae bacterium ANBcel2]|nr:AraC family transcriptional regulator [Marinilabiliaceae bacterium ANBcel2]